MLTKTFKFKNTDTFIEVFDGVSEFHRIQASRPYVFEKDSHNYLYNGFHGVNTIEEYEKLVTHGYNAATEKLKTVNLADGNHSNKFKTEYSVIGYSPCVPRAVQGHPQSMVKRTNKRENIKAMSIIVDIATSGNTSTELILDAGKKIYSLIKQLEDDKGIRCNLYVAVVCDNTNQNIGMFIKVKSSGETLNAGRIGFNLCHPASLRVSYFEWYRKCSDIKKHRESMGRVMSFQQENDAQEICRTVFGKNTNYLSLHQIICKDNYLQDKVFI